MAEPKKLRQKYVRLKLPVADRTSARPSRRTNFQHVETQLDYEQVRGMAHLFAGLYNANYRLRNGRIVQSAADVVRYIMEQAAEGVRGS